MPEQPETTVPPLRIEGGRIVIRVPLTDELDTLAEKIAADPETSPWWGTDVAVVRRDLLGDPDYRVLVVEYQGEPAGVVAFEEETVPEYHSASIDIALLECCVGKGLGSETLRLLIGWLIRGRGHHRITIDPAVANTRAIRAYEKVGFKPVGVMRQYERGPDGTWHDNLLMDLLAREFSNRPT